ncbi:hypothetical protein ACR3CL_003586 [Yersinia enterocolitica]
MCDEIDQAQKLEQLNIKVGIANRKPTMTFTGLATSQSVASRLLAACSVMLGVVMIMRLTSDARGWRHE